MSFVGFFEVGSTYRSALLVRDNGLSPLDADSAPVFRVYGPSGILAGVTGSCSLLDSGNLSTASSATPVVYTSSAAHNLTSGFVVTASGVTGNAGANSSNIITVTAPTTFTMAGTVGSGSGTGGTWHVTGLYTYTFDVTTVNGFAAGTLYVVVIEGTAGGIQFSYTQTMQVN